jgi:hypothetical protein
MFVPARVDGVDSGKAITWIAIGFLTADSAGPRDERVSGRSSGVGSRLELGKVLVCDEALRDDPELLLEVGGVAPENCQRLFGRDLVPLHQDPLSLAHDSARLHGGHQLLTFGGDGDGDRSVVRESLSYREV